MLAYEANTSRNRGIPCIFFTILSRSYLLRPFVYSLTYCIKEFIKVKIFRRLNEKRCLPMRQLWPETGECLATFQNTNTIVFVLFVFLIFDLLYQRGYQGIYFGHWILNCWPIREQRPETGESLTKC